MVSTPLKLSKIAVSATIAYDPKGSMMYDVERML